MSTHPQPPPGKPGVRTPSRISLTPDELKVLEAFIHAHDGEREAAAYRAPAAEGQDSGISYGSLQAFRKTGTITRKLAVKLARAQGVRIDRAEPADQLKKHLLRALRGEFAQPGRRGRFIGTWTGRCLQHKSGKSEPSEIGIWLDLKQGSDTPGSEIGGTGRFSPVSSTDPTTVEIRVFGGFVDASGERLALQYRHIDLSDMVAFGAIVLHMESKSTDITGALAGWGPVSAGWVYGAVELSKQTPTAPAD